LSGYRGWDHVGTLRDPHVVMQNHKKARKPLSLHQETLRVITPAELAVVAGGGTGTSNDTAAKVTSAACGG